MVEVGDLEWFVTLSQSVADAAETNVTLMSKYRYGYVARRLIKRPAAWHVGDL